MGRSDGDVVSILILLDHALKVLDADDISDAATTFQS